LIPPRRYISEVTWNFLGRASIQYAVGGFGKNLRNPGGMKHSHIFMGLGTLGANEQVRST
jgi:hypothetical protein